MCDFPKKELFSLFLQEYEHFVEQYFFSYFLWQTLTLNSFLQLKQLKINYIKVTESGLDNQEVALVFCPIYEWPKCFKFFPLLKV